MSFFLGSKILVGLSCLIFSFKKDMFESVLLRHMRDNLVKKRGFLCLRFKIAHSGF